MTETAAIWQGRRSRALPADIQAAALRKLRLINNAKRLDDLRVPPGNRLEALQGRPHRAAFYPHQRSMADLFRLEGRQCAPSRNRRLPLSFCQIPIRAKSWWRSFCKPMKLSQTALARAIGVPPRRINEIVLGKRAITADTDLRLGALFQHVRGIFYRTADRLRIDGAQARNRRQAQGNKAEGGVNGMKFRRMRFT